MGAPTEPQIRAPDVFPPAPDTSPPAPDTSPPAPDTSLPAPDASLPALDASSPAPTLTVAVLSYDGRHLLETILPSLAAQSYRDFAVVVIDNGSRDDTGEWLARSWPAARVLALAENVGVTRALNVCVRAASSELIALFNNDLELEPNCLGELVAALRAHPEAGWAGPKLLDFHHRDMIDGAGDVLSWGAIGGRRGHGERDVGQYDQPRAIFGACGGAAVFRRSALKTVGPFDEDFFAYYEDVDWNLRSQLCGYSCRYVPSAVVYHMGGATLGAGRSDFTRYHLWRNGIWTVLKDLPGEALLRHLPQLAHGQLHILAAAVRERRLRLWLRAWRDALRGLPLVLAKRREVRSRRRVTGAALDAVMGPDGGRG